MSSLSVPTNSTTQKNRVAVLLPCFNEGEVIYSVVTAFKRALPNSTVYVYDNNSTDNTASEAMRAGATVRQELRRGKGNVVRRMFADIDADIFVLADGDGTYDASDAPRMIEYLQTHQLDTVIGARKARSDSSYRSGHRFGNQLLTTTVNTLFGQTITDMLSGYRIFSRRFVKSFPALSTGFEIETELTVHAMEMRVPMGEIQTEYGTRALTSKSKLRTYRDGFRILATIVKLLKEERPFQLFGVVALVFGTTGLLLGTPVIVEYVETGFVPRFPTAILASALIILSVLSLFSGIIMDSVAHMRREMRRLNYLSQYPRH